jgi:hypothetical protein
MLTGLSRIYSPDWPPMTAIEGKSIRPPALGWSQSAFTTRREPCKIAYPKARRSLASSISSLRLRAYSLEEISASLFNTMSDKLSGGIGGVVVPPEPMLALALVMGSCWFAVGLRFLNIFLVERQRVRFCDDPQDFEHLSRFE